MLMTVGCWCPQLTSVLTCHLLKRKPSPQCAWLLPQLSAVPSTASHTQSASANGVEQEWTMSTTYCLNVVNHVALVASRSKHRALFDGVRDVREWMAAAYKPELAATLGSCMQDRHDALFEGWP